MTIKEQMSIFDIFHDGSISSFSKRGEDLILQIEIKYLAKRISEKYTSFYLTLLEWSLFKFYGLGGKVNIEDLATIVEFEPEIFNSSKDSKNPLKVVCRLSSGDSGELWIKTRDMEVFDEGRNKISYVALKQLSKGYWDEFEFRYEE